MKLELTHQGRETGFETTEDIERLHDVRSLSVTIAEGPDGDRYPRLGINMPSQSSHPAMRPDGITEVAIFDDDVHKAREGFVCGPDEAWLRVVIDRDVRAALDAIVRYDLCKDYAAIGELVDDALAAYLEGYDDGPLPEDVRVEVEP